MARLTRFGPVALVASLALEGWAAASGARLASRSDDPVLVQGDALEALIGRPIDELSLLSLASGERLAPVPFQVDERGPDGDWVFTGGYAADQDDDGGRLDGNDELVFMARDLGERALRDLPAFAGCPEGVIEIEVRDPLTGEVGWVYLVARRGTAERSPTRYVEFDVETDRVESPYYGLTFSERIPFSFSRAVLRDARGDTTPNLVDRLKARATAQMLLGLIEWEVDEEDMLTVSTGYRAGPVRVNRRVVIRIQFGLGLESPELTADMHFYREVVHTPLELHLPVELGLLVTNVEARINLDLLDLRGWSLHTEARPQGLVIDGLPSSEDDAIGAEDAHWLVFVDEKGDGLLIESEVDSGLEGVRTSVYHVDDPSRPDPPEDHPGQGPGLGFRYRDFDAVAEGTHPVQLRIHRLRAYAPGDERAIFRDHDHPLETTARSL